jgi:hypothetical protein
VPIKPENRKLYPKDWKAIRERILHRSDYRCEQCGTAHHAVGYREKDGRFQGNAGNLHCDASGRGEHPDGSRLTWREAQDFVEQYNCTSLGKASCDEDGNHWFVVRLTIAHLDHDPRNNADENIQALCERCHCRLDSKHHAENARATREEKKQRRTWTQLPLPEVSNV